GSVVDAIKEPGNRRAAGDVMGAVTHGLHTLIVACLVAVVFVGIAAYLLGRPAWLMRLLGASGRTLSTGRALDAQVYAAGHASEFMWGGVAVAVVVLWIVGLSWLALGILGLLALAWVALIEYLRRRHPASDAGATV